MTARSRCVIVMTVGRSGSSATSGMLHKLGCPMTLRSWQAPLRPSNNPYGTYEDEVFQRQLRRIRCGKDPLESLRGFIRERAVRPLWGFKAPIFTDVADRAIAMFGLEEVATQVVVARRPREECLWSYRGAYGQPTRAGWHWYRRRMRRLLLFLANYPGPTLDCWWPETLRDPLGQARRLADFIGVEDEALIREAAGHIRRTD